VVRRGPRSAFDIARRWGYATFRGSWHYARRTDAPPRHADHVLVDRSVEAEFTDALVAAITDFYGADPQQSPDYARIVNASHFRRLEKYLAEGTAVTGGVGNPDDVYLAPTVLRDVAPDASVMAEEIFGPILPIVPVDGVGGAIAHVNADDKPLALYVFSRSRATAERVLSSTSSGGACVNHVVYQVAAPQLPFGGVGPSGMGAYHGRAGFEAFSHRRSVLTKSRLIDPPVAYPPFTEAKKKLIRRFM
jgi:acyl-CoA reductase-like NAD-dependent aldehyde dehydrogenase